MLQALHRRRVVQRIREPFGYLPRSSARPHRKYLSCILHLVSKLSTIANTSNSKDKHCFRSDGILSLLTLTDFFSSLSSLQCDSSTGECVAKIDLRFSGRELAWHPTENIIAVGVDDKGGAPASMRLITFPNGI